MEILLEILASESSPLFRQLLDKGLVNESSFSYEYFEGAGYATVMFGGESREPEAVAQAVNREIARLLQDGIPEDAFQRAKRALYGENVAALNSASSIANGVLSLSLKGRELFAYIDALAQITLEDVSEKLSLLREDRSVLSVIRPL